MAPHGFEVLRTASIGKWQVRRPGDEDLQVFADSVGCVNQEPEIFHGGIDPFQELFDAFGIEGNPANGDAVVRSTEDGADPCQGASTGSGSFPQGMP